MAATAPAPPSLAQGGGGGGLPGFTKISNVVYLYRPSQEDQGHARKPSASPSGSSSAPALPPSSPKLIVLAGWMGAREPHLAKYTTRLQALYPDSPIIVLRSFLYHFTTKARLHPVEVAAAVPLVQSIMAEHKEGEDGDDEEASSPEMLVHLFSNGGSAALRHLREQYAAASAGAALPRHVTVFDSAPGRFQVQRSVTAFMASAARAGALFRLALRLVVNCFFGLYWAAHVPWGRAGYLDRTWLSHNDRAQNAAEVRRSYIYSEEDALVDYRDVEEHAASALRGGFVVARLEKFVGSAHVAHVRVDESRYWGVVKDTWENSSLERA
ncbi:Protein-lysine N-methyltransferase efm4 [Diaporthe australafricana]|uniref:Protein-lysine N-methyltransferase efm4 n=1 Tax=Diaporthe australafricana TaxID=127596 RepID=A0ABR3Y6R8_9PEZI